MKIDNSAFQAFWRCPRYWQERYEYNLEPLGRDRSALDFGTRVHQLLEVRHKTMQGVALPEFPPLLDPSLEAEAQLTFAAYEAYYPIEPWEVVGVERYFEVGLPNENNERWWKCTEGCGWGISSSDDVDRYLCPECGAHIEEDFRHTYCGEMDAIIRMKDSGRLWLLETKTEQRGGKGNLPQSWQQKTQVSLYLWAAEQIYGEEFEGILLNIVTRQSPKGQEPPTFRRDSLFRSKKQQEDAVRDLVWVAEQIEESTRKGWFPSNRNECVSRFGWACDYLPLHQTGTRPSEIIQIKFQQAEAYLSGL